MKNIMFGITAILVTVIQATATEIDMAEIKAACEASDELLWDESNEYCVPRNPCLDETGTYSQYCNWKTFENVYSIFYNEWKPLVKIYARVHGLDCEPSHTDGTFVWCTGKDLKVFKFASASDNTYERQTENFEKYAQQTGGFKNAICKNALGGQISKVEEGYGFECKVSGSKCDFVKQILNADAFFADKTTVYINPVTNNCVISSEID
ncbi:MAG: hypothetical protein ACLRFQ_00080 [Alphaproteobacteria bacterium]